VPYPNINDDTVREREMDVITAEAKKKTFFSINIF
jgi:hypothetical protein